MFSIMFAAAISASNAASPSDFSECQLDSDHAHLKDSVCATVQLPLQYSERSKGSVTLFVRKFPAKQSLGSLWLLAGGPGESGAGFYSDISLYQKAFPNMDIYVPDHRGTGASARICPQEKLDSLGGGEIIGQEWPQCFEYIYQNPEYVKSFSITNAAHDISQLISNYSTGKTYVYGVSYGTQLALRVMQLGSVKLDAVVLDSLVPHQLDAAHDLSNRSQVVNSVGQAYLSRILSNSQSVLDKITQFQSKYALLSDADAQLPKVPLSQMLGLLLDNESLREQIPSIVDDVTQKNYDSLNKAITDFTQWSQQAAGGYTNAGMSIMLSQVITSAENNLRLDKTKAQHQKEEAALYFTSPLPKLIAENRLPTYERDEFFAKVPKSDTPVLILHGDLDPKTHIDGAKKHIKLFEGKLNYQLETFSDMPHAIMMSSQKQHAADKIKVFIKKNNPL
ncbi:alpha/beta fold hydrolase [Pseudoalteromonas byunsanensis]|uniref:AB hydrolase-1 domain-containing protein n=1 Tax=Pseudoalteromonas byunsanensis TaxID=327939 RepID=A0A1S1N2E7_9GAMM|nr:alpha/beta fold hydrolase [Pseudoalteromonas byunsanensis]OHU93846.1 hypothetical protein BIW53_16460 [Pseudoalteromonas byunsanensis]